MNIIDLNKFPIIEKEISVIAFNHYQHYKKIQKYNDVAERIYGCYFLLFKGQKNENSETLLQKTIYFRALVNELVSISEMLKKCDNENLQNLSIDKTDLPLLHFFKLLREINFHLSSIDQQSFNNNISYFHKENKEEILLNSIINQLILSNCNSNLFKNLHNIKYYNIENIEKVVQWVNNNQKVWGIFHIIDLAVRQYCIEIEKHCT